MNLLLLPVVAGLALAAPLQAASTDPLVAPSTVVSADGLSVTDGVRTLSTTQAAELDPNGTTVTITGSGYDDTKGIYVAFCVVHPLNAPPSPCGGGAATGGSTGASQWVSSNPPSYGEGLAVPYGPGGTFTATLVLTPTVNATAGIDCRDVACAIITRNDHTRGSDRGQDLFIPVTFAAPGAPPPTTAPPATTPPTTAPSSPTTAPPTTTGTAPAVTATTGVAPTMPPTPTTTLTDGGRAVSDGTRRLRVDQVGGLDPDGAELSVDGRGYDATKGVYVAFCALPEPGQVPGPCSTGSVGTSAWISSNPPDYGADLARPYGDGGSFSTTIEVTAVIDSETDCREVRCGVVTRNDDTNHDDRSQDLFVPVAFDGGDVVLAGTTGDAGGGDVPWLAVGGVVLVAVAASTPFGVKRRERKLAGARTAS